MQQGTSQSWNSTGLDEGPLGFPTIIVAAVDSGAGLSSRTSLVQKPAASKKIIREASKQASALTEGRTPLSTVKEVGTTSVLAPMEGATIAAGEAIRQIFGVVVDKLPSSFPLTEVAVGKLLGWDLICSHYLGHQQ